MDTGLLTARLILGLALSAHGVQKLFGWFGGYGFRGTGGFLDSLGFRPGALFALAAGLGELPLERAYYHCAACGQALCDSRTKYDSGTGWPSFWAALDKADIVTE
jgi:hypothetical protein